MKLNQKPQTIEEVIEPLIEVLNRCYHTHDDREFEVAELDLFDVLNSDRDGVAVWLPDNITEQPAANAIATLLSLTGSESTWISGNVPTGENLDGPLRFSLTKRSVWAGYFWAGGRFLVIDHVGSELDGDAATRQVAALVQRLQNPANLVELSAKDLGLLF